jgi:hypothetical protein
VHQQDTFPHKGYIPDLAMHSVCVGLHAEPGLHGTPCPNNLMAFEWNNRDPREDRFIRAQINATCHKIPRRKRRWSQTCCRPAGSTRELRATGIRGPPIGNTGYHLFGVSSGQSIEQIFSLPFPVSERELRKECPNGYMRLKGPLFVLQRMEALRAVKEEGEEEEEGGSKKRQ